MILRELQQAANTQEIGAAVTYVSNAKFRAVDPRGGHCRAHAVLFRVGAMLHEGLHCESAGDFTVRFATHAIGEHKKVQWRNDAETIFVVCAHATYVAHAATHDSHTSSHCCRQSTPCLHRYQAILFPR